VRAAVAERGAVIDFWCSDRPVFEGTPVLTCVPVVRIGADPPTDPDAWGALAAPYFGVPDVGLATGGGTIGDLATCTADFRDQYYGLQPFVRDGGRDGHAPLVTSGLIDPAECRWGRATTRFARQEYDAPAGDLAALHEHGGLSRWAEARLVPKLLVAGQGRVVEAVVDVAGSWLPSVPVVTVVPRDDGEEHLLWRLLALTLAPPLVAHAAARYLGTGLTPGSVKLSARQVAALPLPLCEQSWAAGAQLAQQAQEATDPADRLAILHDAAAVMAHAYGDRDGRALSWWLGRLGTRVHGA
jgi:hypothetical protein